MKKTLYIFTLLAAILFSACEKDNYDEPGATLSGAVMYEGDALRVKSGEVTLRLYEMGWTNSASAFITVNVDQNGTFSQKVFSGRTYKLIISENGPWNLPTTSDSITLKVNGDIQQNVEVRPYFLLENVRVTSAMAGDEQNVTAEFDVRQIDPNAEAEYAELYINENYIIDAQRTSQTKTIPLVSLTSENTIDIILNETVKKYDFVYARIGLKIKNEPALLYSEIIKIDIQK